MEIMRGVDAQLFQAFGNRVVYGPFKGMEIKQDPVWKDGNVSAKLLGCYEFELTAAINKAIGRRPKTVVNIGCADGYYAIGLARLLIDATVFAIDVDEISLRECWEMAHRNGVVDRMQFHKGCYYAKDLDLEEVSQDGRLYFVDCEGDERKLLNKNECPVLAKSDIIVECHEFMREGITEQLQRHFADTHEIEVIKPELPPLGRYPLLAEAPTVMTILAITEKRPMPTRWLACWAH
jgi:hypothetical protein